VLVDTHAHLSFPQFSTDREAVIGAAASAGVTRVIDVGTDLETSREAAALAASRDGVSAGVGFHPHDAPRADAGGLAQLERLLAQRAVVAVGETGLDFYRDYAPAAQQERAFIAHIELALRHDMPLIVHSRAAETRVLRVLEDEGLGRARGVLHCFGGSSDEAERAVELGFYLGFGGTITYKNSSVLEVALNARPDRVLLETDCPYLPPTPYRGRRNEPAHVRTVAQFLADARSVALDVVAEETSGNAVRLFGLTDS